MRGARIPFAAACLGALLAAGGGAGANGSISTSGATIAAGTAPTLGTVTMEDCAAEAAAPVPSAPAPLGSIGSMTGSLPMFPGGGTGADGAFHATATQSLAGGTYNFTSYLVDEGVTVTYTAGVTILATGDVTIHGRVVTTTADSPITIRCAGEFVVDGTTADAYVRTAVATSPVTIDAGRSFTARASDGIEAQIGDVTVTAYGTAAGTGDVNLAGGYIEDASSAGAGQGTVTIRAKRSVIFTANARAQSDSDPLLVQAFGGDVTYAGNSFMNADEGPLTVEASGEVTLTGEASLNTRDGAVAVTAFGGDLLFDGTMNEAYVNTLDGNLSLRAAGSILFTNGSSYVNTRFGTVSLTAFGGDVGLDHVDSYLNALGPVSVNAADDFRCQGYVNASGGASIDAHGGTISFTGSGRMTVRGSGATDLRAATRIEFLQAMGGYSFLDAFSGGGDLRLAAGTGGVDLRFAYLSSDTGGISIATEGPITLRASDDVTARGPVTLTSATGGIDVAGSTIVTDDMPAGPGVTDSAPILLESFGGAAGAIDADGATIRSGTSDDASGSVTLRVHQSDAVPVIESFFLPKKVTAKFNAAAPGKSTLVAIGILDTGPNAPDLASAASIDVGGVHVDVPGLVSSKKGFTYDAQGLSLVVKPNPYGSSRAKFNLKYTGDLTGKVAANGPLVFQFANAAADGGCQVALAGGAFGLGRVRGALIEPNLFVVRARAELKGPGKDALSMIVGLATGGTTPAQAADLTVGFGDALSATIPSASFRRKGDVDTFTGDVGGVTKVVVDYARELIAVTGKGLTLGTFAEGGNSVLLSVGLGNDARAVRVRMGRIGGTMKY